MTCVYPEEVNNSFHKDLVKNKMEVENSSEMMIESNLNDKDVERLKIKQTENIIKKITRIIQNVVPIHEEQEESDNEMHDLIEEMEAMDLE